MSMLSYKTKQFFFILIKMSIVVAAFYFIYYKLVNNGALDFYDFTRFLTQNNVFSLQNTLFLLALTVLNWFFEISKWRILVSSIQKINFITALEQSLGALTASLFTPNRIGEYGAKAIYFPSTQRKRVLLLNLISNVYQMSITTIFGCIGFWGLTRHYAIKIDYLNITKILGIIILIIALVYLGFRQTKNKGILIKKLKRFVFKLPLKAKCLVYLFSLIRYAIFSFQFYFLLRLFGVELSYLEAMTIITSMYLLSSIIPTLFVLDVIVKGGVAVYLFTFADVNEFTVLCIITLMWGLNFVIPSLIGGYYVLNFNYSKTKIK